MKQGLLFTGHLPLNDTVAIGRAAEQAGFDSLYHVEAYRGAFVPLAALAVATKRVRIGSYIANAYMRTPFGLGLAALDLDELCGGRLVLGVGSGNSYLNRHAQGIKRKNVEPTLREYVNVVSRMLSAEPGAPVDCEGDIYPMHWEPSRKPLRNRIPIYLAAIFPKMMNVAASVADGIAHGVLLSPEYLREVIHPRVQQAAEAAGRDPGEISMPMAAVIAVDEDRAKARQAVKAAIAGFFHPLPHSYYEFLLREQGYGAVVDQAKKRVAAGRPEAIAELIDDELVDRVALAGTAADVSRRLEDYAGLIDEVIYLNVGGSDAADAMAAHEPLFAVRPPA